VYRWLIVPLVASLVTASAAVSAQAAYVPPIRSATLVSANPVDTTPHAQNGSFRAFAQIGTTIYAGGSFTSVKNAGAASWSARGYLIAYDQATGVIRTGFAPVLDNAVQALAVSPAGKLIVGGNFGTVNGVARKNLVALDPVTGATVAGFVGRADGGLVRRTVVVGNQLYVAGAFHWINGTQHSLLARLNATTGAVDPAFQIDASVARQDSELVWSMAVSPDGKTLVAVGNFTVVNTLSRNQVVLVDLTPAVPRVAGWHTDRYVAPCYSTAFPFYARDVDFSDDGSYFVIAADGGRGDGYCDTISRWETADRGPDVAATWVDYTGADSVTSLEAADGVVYAAGHFRWLNNTNGNDSAGDGAISRYGIGALDAANGMPLAWNPTRSPGGNLPVGGVGWGPIVWELWRGSTGLLVGQDSDGLGNEYHGRLAMLPLAGGRTIAVADAPKGAVGQLYLGAGNGKLLKQSYNGTTVGAGTASAQPNLTAYGASFLVGTKLYWAKSDPNAVRGSVFQASTFTAGRAGVPWLTSTANAWYAPAAMTGAFALGGRMYYTTASSNNLFYRYLGNDGSIVGCTQFVVPTTGFDWRVVRGIAWSNGRLLYGSTDGTLRSVVFDPAAPTGVAVDAATKKILARPTATRSFSSRTLFFAPS
jgi:hypothetical protein